MHAHGRLQIANGMVPISQLAAVADVQAWTRGLCVEVGTLARPVPSGAISLKISSAAR
jgi:hypothetical protein